MSYGYDPAPEPPRRRHSADPEYVPGQGGDGYDQYTPPPGGTPFGQQYEDPPEATYQRPSYDTPPPAPAYQMPQPEQPRSTSKGWLGVLAGTLAVLLLVGLGAGAYFLLDDKKAPAPKAAASPSASPSASASASASAAAKDISSQVTDPAPLTELELFPTATLSVDTRTYSVQKTQSLTDCKLATSGDLGPDLVKLGCGQVVRATLFSPKKDFVLTTGVFNFKDTVAAGTAKDHTKALLASGKGFIAGWAVGGGTDIIGTADTYLQWVPYGHFMTYTVLARADGKKPDPADPLVQQALKDTTELFLKTQLKKRAA